MTVRHARPQVLIDLRADAVTEPLSSIAWTPSPRVALAPKDSVTVRYRAAVAGHVLGLAVHPLPPTTADVLRVIAVAHATADHRVDLVLPPAAGPGVPWSSPRWRALFPFRLGIGEMVCVTVVARRASVVEWGFLWRPDAA